MHYLIRIIGEAHTPYGASDNATDFADTLVEQGEFDYYNASPDRFDEAGMTIPLASEAGRLAVERALAETRDEFMRAIQVVRLMLQDFTDEQIYQEIFPEPDDGNERDYSPSRYALYLASGHGNTVYIYGDEELWGGRIHNDREYTVAVGGTDPATLWVTNLDMHN